MKYEILGFNQSAILELKSGNGQLFLDLHDLLILDWIKNNTGKYAHELKFIDNKVYTWITYKNVLEDLPILDIAEKRLYQRIKKYKELGLVDIITQCEQGLKGSKTYVCREELFETLWIDQSKNIYGGSNNQSKNIYGGQPDQSKNIYSQYNNINNDINNNIKTISKDIVGKKEVNKSSNEDCNSPQAAPSTSKTTNKIVLGKRNITNSQTIVELKARVKKPVTKKETENSQSKKEVRKLSVANKAIEIAVNELNIVDNELIKTIKDWFANCYEQKGMSTSDTRFGYALESLRDVINRFPKETVLKLIKQAILRSHITLEYVVQEFSKPKYNNKNDIYKFPGMQDNETVDEYLARKKKEEEQNKALVDSVVKEIQTGNKTGQWV